ncbi:hypothetical protein HOY34_16640 [Xinfangfangia sp. D13-10-4-6]|uniref:transferrin-binding protein-like solute binding protein n=1 Tax=Pseudogemmobacter hezensis TaxID=2737662 RepID=UPI001552A3BF|nr:transferrin-binding protein-like solute binding protein [Pseudogemmobacter hezensis]NPD16822.1 hypothetical protein [Pseudogemmobacter hezensis]
MSFYLRIPAALAVLSLMTACSGGGGDDSPTVEYASDAANAARLVAETANLSQTSASSMPVTGRAEYDGVVGMAFGGAPASIASAQMLGEMDLTANFATGQISGEFDDFNTAAGQELNGALRVTNGRITGNGFAADINGNLTGAGTAPGAVTGAINGDFLGTNAAAIEGTGSATSTAGNLGLVFVGTLDRD